MVLAWLDDVEVDVDMPVAEDLKRARFGDALKDIAPDKAQMIRLLVVLVSEYDSTFTV
jgi:hypothetical protein